MKDELRAFLEVIFEDGEGIICLSTKDKNSGKWKDYFFYFPNEIEEAVNLATSNAIDSDVYFCPNLLGDKYCRKDSVIGTSCIWADVDECDPDDFSIKPSVTVETSFGKTQAYWLMGRPRDPQAAERIAKAIAYENTTDKNGWNLARKLRLPSTFNHKYDPTHRVKIRDFSGERYDLDKLLSVYNPSEVEQLTSDPEVVAPDNVEPAHDVLERYKVTLNPRVFDIFYNEPNQRDWSSTLWQLELLLIESGLDDEEVFAIAREAACNKYKRDNRPESELFSEILKARERNEQSNVTTPIETVESPFVSPILTPTQREEAANTKDLVQEYIEWAKNQSDAAWQYHQAGIFTVLSTLLTGSVRLPMSFGMMLPNMWFMILGDTTLTRKSTAMDMATDLLEEVDPDALLATDGSIEGLLTQLSTRPGRPSLFLRDEITGLIESIQKKDYYAGMFETLTKLYDGKRQKRVLRKEEIDVKEPNFLLFAGGIKSKFLSLLNYEHIMSGFLPRFCFVSAESDTTKLKPVGPPTQKDTKFRDQLIIRLIHIHKHFWQAQNSDGSRKRWDVSLTDEAWYQYNQFEYKMVNDVIDSPQKDVMTPIMSRLANSGLKAAMILAAVDPSNLESVTVTTDHLFRAFYFIEQWREHALEIVLNIGSSDDEQKISHIMSMIQTKPGISRSELMRHTQFKPQEMDQITTTLIQREMIYSSKDEDKRIHFRPTQ